MNLSAKLSLKRAGKVLIAGLVAQVVDVAITVLLPDISRELYKSFPQAKPAIDMAIMSVVMALEKYRKETKKPK